MLEGILVLVIVFGAISLANAYDIHKVVKYLNEHPYHMSERIQDMSDEEETKELRKILVEMRTPADVEIGISKFAKQQIKDDNARKIAAQEGE